MASTRESFWDTFCDLKGLEEFLSSKELNGDAFKSSLPKRSPDTERKRKMKIDEKMEDSQISTQNKERNYTKYEKVAWFCCILQELFGGLKYSDHARAFQKVLECSPLQIFENVCGTQRHMWSFSWVARYSGLIK